MKKMLIGILVSIMVIIPFNSAFAEGTTPTGTTPTVKQQQNLEKKAAREAFKAGVAQKKADLKAQYERNQALRVSIKAKHISIRTSLAELRKLKTDTSKAKIAQVKTALVNLTPSKETLKGLKDAGKPYWEQFRVNAKAMNLEAALVNLNSVASVKDSRFEQLTKINATLDSIIAILAQ